MWHLSLIRNLGIINYVFTTQFLPPKKSLHYCPAGLQRCLSAWQTLISRCLFWLYGFHSFLLSPSPSLLSPVWKSWSGCVVGCTEARVHTQLAQPVQLSVGRVTWDVSFWKKEGGSWMVAVRPVMKKGKGIKAEQTKCMPVCSQQQRPVQFGCPVRCWTDGRIMHIMLRNLDFRLRPTLFF